VFMRLMHNALLNLIKFALFNLKYE
jgi:hypothetical protein